MSQAFASLLSLRNKQDLRCLGVLAVYPLIVTWHFLIGPRLWLSLLTALFAYVIGCIQHCHGHWPFFRSRSANRAIEFLFTLYRFDGCYAWKATHNANHHRYANSDADYTYTYRYSHHNDLPQFLRYLAHGVRAYFRASFSYWLSLVSKPRNTSAFRLGLLWSLQIATWLTVVLTLWHIDAKTTAYALLLPQAFGVLAMVGTGYFQHHHTDTHHPYNSSRNFVGIWLNRITFNHGFHLVHHRNINMHWSQWPQEHHRLSHRIHPQLNEPSLAFYFLKIFVLQHFSRLYRTDDLRRPDALQDPSPSPA